MPAIPCQSKIDCQPCQDEPILNVSAEAADVDRYLGRFSFLNAIPPIRQYPDFDQDGGGILLQVGCMRWCWSTISQEDADDCARRQAIECAFNPLIPGFPIPDEFHPNRIALYYNQAVAGTYVCPDGNVFTYTIAANQIVALTQGEANATAFALAKLRAKEHRVCISDMNDPICVDTWVTKQITASGPNVAVFPATDRWELVSGTIPPGMTLETGFTSDGIEFSGIPTTIGEYSFRVRCTISTFGSPGFGDFMEKVFTVKIVGINEDSPLPDAVLGVAYHQQLTAGGSTNTTGEIWTVTSGSLPDGLSLSPQGLIEGTPTGALAGYAFTVQAQFPVGSITALCSKNLTITVMEAIGGYWKMDEATGNRLDSLGNADLIVSGSNPPSVAGIISNAIGLTSTFAATEYFNTGAPVSALAFDTDGFTFNVWKRLVTLGNNNPRFQPFNIRFYDSASTLVGQAVVQFSASTISTFTFVLWSNHLIASTTSYTFSGIGSGVWRMMTLRYRPDGFFELIINATFPSEVTPTSLIIPAHTKGDIRVFGEHNFLSTAAEVHFDEMGYFKRQLTNDEITHLYNSGAGRTYPDVP